MTGNYDEEYFSTITSDEEPQAQRLAKIIKETFSPKTVADIGCGNGLYVRELQHEGIEAFGVDYSVRHLDRRAILADHVYQADITSDDSLDLDADLVLCLEVLEHIEDDKADSAIDYICKTAPIVLFSAAVPGQGGEGHINCQPKTYWEQKFRERGFVRSPELEYAVLHEILQGYHMGWLANNLMILKKEN